MVYPVNYKKCGDIASAAFPFFSNKFSKKRVKYQFKCNKCIGKSYVNKVEYFQPKTIYLHVKKKDHFSEFNRENRTDDDLRLYLFTLLMLIRFGNKSAIFFKFFSAIIKKAFARTGRAGCL